MRACTAAGKVDKSRSPAWAGGAAAQDGNATVSNDFAALNASFLSTITAQAAGKGKDVVDLTPCCNEYIAFAENIRATSRPVPSAVGVGARSPVQGSADTTMAVDTDAASAEADDEDGDALYTIPKYDSLETPDVCPRVPAWGCALRLFLCRGWWLLLTVRWVGGGGRAECECCI